MANRDEIRRHAADDPVSLYTLEFGHRWGIELRTIPEHMRYHVVCYVLLGDPPGDFLTALLTGDLFETYRTADDVNRYAILDYVRFCHLAMPVHALRDNVRWWIESGGIIGLREKESENERTE